MLLDPEGYALNQAAAALARQGLSDGGWPWIPEITNLKHGTKEFGADWRATAGTFDPQQEFRCLSGLMLNTASALPDILCFDCDTDDQEAAAGCSAAIESVAGICKFVRTRVGSHRFARLYRCEEDAACQAGLQGSEGGIELLTGPTCKLTMFGVHTNKKTGILTRNQWGPLVPGSDNGRVADLQVITVDQVLEALALCGPHLGDDVVLLRRDQRQDDRAGDPVADDIDELCRAFSFIPNSATMPWPTWNRWGMALYRATDGDDRGLLAWAEWTAAGVGTKHRDWFDRWQAYSNCPPTVIGAGSIFFVAGRHGYKRKPMSGKELLAWRARKEQKWRNKNFTARI